MKPSINSLVKIPNFSMLRFSALLDHFDCSDIELTETFEEALEVGYSFDFYTEGGAKFSVSEIDSFCKIGDILISFRDSRYEIVTSITKVPAISTFLSQIRCKSKGVKVFCCGNVYTFSYPFKKLEKETTIFVTDILETKRVVLHKTNSVLLESLENGYIINQVTEKYLSEEIRWRIEEGHKFTLYFYEGDVKTFVPSQIRIEVNSNNDRDFCLNEEIPTMTSKFNDLSRFIYYNKELRIRLKEYAFLQKDIIQIRGVIKEGLQL